MLRKRIENLSGKKKHTIYKVHKIDGIKSAKLKIMFARAIVQKRLEGKW